MSKYIGIDESMTQSVVHTQAHPHFSVFGRHVSSLDFWDDPEEDIYTFEDGEEVWDAEWDELLEGVDDE